MHGLRGLRQVWRRGARGLAGLMPTGLFGRSLIIIVAPMLLLQTVVAFVFMERHWQSVTDRLSSAVVRDIAGIVKVLETYPQDEEYEAVTQLARTLGLRVSVLEDGELPPPARKPFFSILDAALTRELTEQIERPFWFDTVGRSDLLEIRIRLDQGVLRVYVPRKSAYASNTHIFLLWMVGAAVVLLLIAILFLRNQIRPIQRLAEAAERFGKGQSTAADLTPRGAREVRRATVSFVKMRDRIERAIDQRTTMLAGVSHDLRTVLTRFRLQLALVPSSEETEALVSDINQMQSMLQGYLDFAQGDTGEVAQDVDLNDVLAELEPIAWSKERQYDWSVTGDPVVHVRPVAFRRLVTNLVTNALRHGERVDVLVHHGRLALRLTVDDDGPGIAEAMRDDVFKPFMRLDEARNLDDAGTGLGLAIARDIALGHGGDITLDTSPMGGLRAVVSLPV